MKKALYLSAVILLVSSFTSCSSTALTSSWTKEGYTTQKYNKVLVFALASKTSNRAAVEGAMTEEFKKAGINAVSSLSIFPGSVNLTAQQIAAIPKEDLVKKFKDNNIDGFLILSLLDKKEEQVYIQGQTYTQPTYMYHPSGYYNRYYPYYTDYYGYYSNVYNTVTEPGYYDQQTTFYLESNFYNVDQATLVWSAQSEAVDPSDIGKGAKDWAKEVVNGLKLDKVILP